MILPNIQGQRELSGKYFFFAADKNYFDLYGKPLAMSLKIKAPWAKVHTHLYNPTPEQINWCESKSISYTYEQVDENYQEFKTYCACVRFIRIPEIFKDNSRVIAFDCDVIANKEIPENKFIEDTNISKVTVKKNKRALASAITFGPDKFRHEYSNRLRSSFEKDNIYWFLDQDVLDEMIEKNLVQIMGFDWTGTKMTDHQMIWTAKGERKNSKEQYVKLLEFYRSII